MRSGQLMDVVTLQTQTSADNADGEPILTWGTYETTRGRMEQLTVTRKFENNGRTFEAVARVMVRWRAAYSALRTQPVRVVLESITYDLAGIQDSDDRRSCWLYLSRVV